MVRAAQGQSGDTSQEMDRVNYTEKKEEDQDPGQEREETHELRTPAARSKGTQGLITPQQGLSVSSPRRRKRGLHAQGKVPKATRLESHKEGSA